MKVLIVDYGAGNLHSVARALSHEGGTVIVSSAPDDVSRADRLVLPGVGAFADAMKQLAARGLVEPVRRFLETGRPFLGICVGMQMLLTYSTEFGNHGGLDVVPGAVVRIPSDHGVKVPHVGWNEIRPARPGVWRDTCLEGLGDQPMAYFVHSYNAEPAQEEDRLADASHGDTRICAAIRRGNAVGVQFHPEMSGSLGLAVLRRFLTA